jgi:hypothetical protein
LFSIPLAAVIMTLTLASLNLGSCSPICILPSVTLVFSLDRNLA